MISCREICKLYFWCNDITLFSPYDFYNALKSTFATDVVGCLCQLEASNFGFAPGPKNHRAGPGEGALPPLSGLGAQYVETRHNITIGVTCLKLWPVIEVPQLPLYAG